MLGPQHYGFLEFTLAVMVFFTLPADLGLGAYGAREIARDPDRGHAVRLLHEITGLRMALALGSIALLAVFIVALRKPFDLKLLLAFYGVSLLAGPFLLQWFFQAHDQMQWVGAASIVRQGVFGVLAFLLCRRGVPLPYIGMIECGSVLAVSGFCIWVTHHKMGFPWPWPTLRIGALASHLSESVPIGLTEVAWAFMWYFSTVLLGLIFSDWSLGWFGASHRHADGAAYFRVAVFFQYAAFHLALRGPAARAPAGADGSLGALHGLDGPAPGGRDDRTGARNPAHRLRLVLRRSRRHIRHPGMDAAGGHAERASPLYSDRLQAPEAVALRHHHFGRGGGGARPRAGPAVPRGRARRGRC